MSQIYDRYRHAAFLFEHKLYSQAAKELEAVLTDHAAETLAGQLPTGTGDAHLLLARAYYHSAQLGRAEAAARAIVERDPDDVYAVLLLARTLSRRGKHVEAGGWLRRADALGADTWAAQPKISLVTPELDDRDEHGSMHSIQHDHNAA